MQGSSPLPVLLCFDVEPDDRHVEGRPESWPGAEATPGMLERWRRRLSRATARPARFSWFLRLDPQIAELYGTALWPVVRYGSVLRELAAAGDEIGLHVHTWRRDPQGAEDRWVCDFTDGEWTAHCVRAAFAAFEEAFGRSCTTFRFGERWMSQAAFELLERLGARFDLSLEPGHFDYASWDLKHHFHGTFPDCRQVPTWPYRPARSDFRRPGRWGLRRRLWVVPVSTAPVANGTEPGSDVQTLFLSAPPRLFTDSLGALLDSANTRHLAIVARTDVGSRPDEAALADENLASLERAASVSRRLEFVTPATAVAMAEALRAG